ncbi:MAG: adenosylmethionine--8-amino-7-oxononanoate transaminase [Pirellulaceae bacterium]
MNASRTELLRQRDREVLWHPYTRQSAFDGTDFPVIARGEGIYLYDTDSRQYLDAISSWWACNLGHSRPELVDAIRRQAGILQHSVLGNMSHPCAIELAERICSLFPDRRRVFFSSDGASAVEAGLKIAAQYWHNVGHPEKCRFVSLEGAYHGDTLGAVSVGFMESFHRPFQSLVARSLQAEAPCCGTCKYGRNATDCELECFESMRAILSEHAGALAAVIVEPLCQGASGMRIYSPRYLAALGKLCKEKNVLLFCDEIAVGLGRTGKMFASEHANVLPDILTIGKGLSGGYLPISATVVTDAIYQTFHDTPSDNTFYHGHTFAGNPIAAAVSLEVLDIYRREGIVERAAASGNTLADAMQAVANLDGVSNVRCLGMIAAAQLSNSDIVQRARKWLLDQGILVRPLGNVIYLMLPLITSEQVIRATVDQLVRAISGSVSECP